MSQQYNRTTNNEREYNKIKDSKCETLVNATRTFLGSQV